MMYAWRSLFYKIRANQEYIRTKVLNSPFELPSLEQIEEMERQRFQGDFHVTGIEEDRKTGNNVMAKW